MDRILRIPICNAQIDVSMDTGGKAFTVHLFSNDIDIVLTEDTDGAQYWFEKERENQTLLSRKIGDLIETEMAKIM